MHPDKMPDRQFRDVSTGGAVIRGVFLIGAIILSLPVVESRTLQIPHMPGDRSLGVFSSPD